MTINTHTLICQCFPVRLAALTRASFTLTDYLGSETSLMVCETSEKGELFLSISVFPVTELKRSHI